MNIEGFLNNINTPDKTVASPIKSGVDVKKVVMIIALLVVIIVLIKANRD